MSQEDDKRIVREFLETVWNRGDLAGAIDKYRDPSCVSHGLGQSDFTDTDRYRAFVGVVRARLRDTRMEIHEMLAEGDRVAFRATLHATANGKPVRLPGMGVVRVVSGKMVESHNGWDALALLAQLGEAPKSLEDVLR